MEDDYRYSVAYDDNVVTVWTTGSFDYLKGLQMWKEIIATCEQHQCFDILAISRVAKPLPAPDLFNSREFFDAVGLTAEYRLAVVNENEDVRESHKVAAAALKTRRAAAPFSAAVFSNERDARRWLSRRD